MDAGLSRAQCPSRLPSLTILESPTFGTVGSRARWATRPFLGANGGLEAIKSLAPSFGRKISHVVAKRGKADWSRFQGVGCKCEGMSGDAEWARWQSSARARAESEATMRQQPPEQVALAFRVFHGDKLAKVQEHFPDETLSAPLLGVVQRRRFQRQGALNPRSCALRQRSLLSPSIAALTAAALATLAFLLPPPLPSPSP